MLGVGFFWRVKNTGTWDPRGFFRKDATTEFVAVPDICGYRARSPLLGVYIEAKFRDRVENCKKLIFSVKISEDQKKFLRNAHKAGHLAGVAFTLDDAIAIAMNDPKRYVRHPRTYLFMPEEEHEGIIERYKAEKKALSLLKQDPVACATFLARTFDEPIPEDCL